VPTSVTGASHVASVRASPHPRKKTIVRRWLERAGPVLAGPFDSGEDTWRPPFHTERSVPRAAPRTAVTRRTLPHECQSVGGSRTDQLDFSIADLLAVRLAVPGAIAQICVAVALGSIVAIAFGATLDAAIVFGLAISVASTVVLLRTLRARDLLDTDAGRTAVGWLIVEDLFTVLVLVLLPTIPVIHEGGGIADAAIPVVEALAKAGIFTAIMLVVGPRVLPRALTFVERIGSRELFTIAVLGIAFAASLVFDVSLALGAFLAGAVLSESRLSGRAASDLLPMTDVFTVLFFVSVGMLLDPAILMDEPATILAVLAVIVLGKSMAAPVIVAIRRAPLSTGLTVAAGLAQIGEFSFIVATARLELSLISADAFQILVAAALISITLNPFLFTAIGPAERWLGSPGLGRLFRASGSPAPTR
jgi:monovalent cation:H+ antiporter-2, CPA2 family